MSERYKLVIWCHECKEDRHRPELCPSAGLETSPGSFPTIEAARRWVEVAAIDKRVPWRFAVEDPETGDRIILTGFRLSDWD
jgi:hypothetical protein